MRLLISDANVLIDFEAGGVTAALFDLGAGLAVPDVLFEEELKASHAALIEHGLRVLALSSESVSHALQLALRHRRPRRNDLLALALAVQERCPLVTGDRALRSAAVAEGVEVHGTLWLMTEVRLRGVRSVGDLREAYGRMRAAGRRLPWDEVRTWLELHGVRRYPEVLRARPQAPGCTRWSPAMYRVDRPGGFVGSEPGC